MWLPKRQPYKNVLSWGALIPIPSPLPTPRNSKEEETWAIQKGLQPIPSG